MRGWFTDAQQAGAAYREVAFRNAQIDSFLEKEDNFIIVASKGMGKTLLLRLKRDYVQKHSKGITLIPQNLESDYVNLGGSFNKDLLKAMRTQRFWEQLWQLAISVSALLHFPHQLSPEQLTQANIDLGRTGLPDELRGELIRSLTGTYRSQRTPSDVLQQLLSLPVSRIEALRSQALHVLHDLAHRHIVSACFIFIDSFDQALTNAGGNDLDIWCAGQCGLLKAAWEVSRFNQHIKVYVTIRQEAYASFRDPVSINIRGSILLIEYSADELRSIFTKHVQHHEGLASIEEFVGMDRVYNSYLRTREDVFEYINRHTIGVPRWFADIGAKLALESGPAFTPTQRRDRLRNIVNREAASLAASYLRDEMRPFFRGENPDTFINSFLRTINSTVLSLGQLKRLSEAYVAMSPTPVEHPFCLLFNFGLLGYVRREYAAANRVQYFRKPYEFDWNFDGILPSHPTGRYLIHPALNEIIQSASETFSPTLVRIGDSLAWRHSDDRVVGVNTLRIFVSYARTDQPSVKPLIDAIDHELFGKCTYDIWFDEWRMEAGKWIQDQLLDGLRKSDYLILMVSRSSLGSAAVSAEWKTHFAEKLRHGKDSVFPLMIDDTAFGDLPSYLSNIYARRCVSGDDPEVKKFAQDLVAAFQNDKASKPRKKAAL